MTENYLDVRALSVGYNGTAVVRNINLSVKKSEIVALIGPNGAGKSTFLKTVARDLVPIEGQVLLEGKSISAYSYREMSRKMAVILTDRIKVELATCYDIVATGRYPYTGRLGILRKEDQRIVENALEAVHAQDLAERDFAAISDGQRQRVLLARAICHELDHLDGHMYVEKVEGEIHDVQYADPEDEEDWEEIDEE